MKAIDQYYTIAQPSPEVLLKEKGSKFYGYAYPVANDHQVKSCIEKLKKEHHSARHWCYAYQIGIDPVKYRVNDDGEPNNSAGKPIYGQIQSFDLTDIVIVVVRYFGGTKLGVGGLITAYKSTAKMAIESSHIISKSIDISFLLNFEYKDLNKVMRIIKEKNIRITDQVLEMNCTITIKVRKSVAKNIKTVFENLYGVFIKEL